MAQLPVLYGKYFALLEFNKNGTISATNTITDLTFT